MLIVVRDFFFVILGEFKGVFLIKDENIIKIRYNRKVLNKIRRKKRCFFVKKILVVDDEKLILEIVKYNLVKEGYEVFIVYDGEEVFEKVEEVELDLIILDLMFFKMDGLEVV